MAEARQREQWNHTANLLAAVLNSQPGRKRAIKPKNLHPFYAKRGFSQSREPNIDGDTSCLKVFLPKHKRSS